LASRYAAEGQQTIKKDILYKLYGYRAGEREVHELGREGVIIIAIVIVQPFYDNELFDYVHV
jgi:hypothetical protein